MDENKAIIKKELRVDEKTGQITIKEMVRKNFFWGGVGGEVSKKPFAWVSWQKCLKPFHKGGINIGSLLDMNRALLAKWWWRFRVEGGSLWGSVIRNIYGSEGGLGVGESSFRGTWGSVWKNVVGVGKSLDESGLYRLASDPNASIFEQGEWVGERWVWHWSWLRELRGRTLGEFVELQRRLVGWEPVKDKSDSWGWEFDLDKGFSVPRLRHILADVSTLGDGNGGTLWVPFLPKKVNVFRWRLKLGRIPTKEALDNMGIDLDSLLCPRCGEEVEGVDHVFINCAAARDLWSRVGRWWKKSLVDIHSVSHLLQEDDALLGSLKNKAWWVGVKWIFLYLIWDQRNKLVFDSISRDLADCFFEWQRLAFEWISNRVKGLQLDWYEWLSGLA
ncbi:hypothetical protein OSB04_009428 [Centaurea solstitialis]|uniref:Reverse transcriptase zinc-binding domain-containing protein n=1 Tax=Centaurea solstitialis TaxID=347529 RepID=A0AA38T7A4_9ASTR|nr:hypothetical protein OSB04_009428 [Centaurea solstitialis]